MTRIPDEPNDRKAKAEERNAQAEMKARSGREAMADYRARETAADNNANRLKGLRLARDAEAAASKAEAPTATPKARHAKKPSGPDEGLRPGQLTAENDE